MLGLALLFALPGCGLEAAIEDVACGQTFRGRTTLPTEFDCYRLNVLPSDCVLTTRKVVGCDIPVRTDEAFSAGAEVELWCPFWRDEQIEQIVQSAEPFDCAERKDAR